MKIIAIRGKNLASLAGEFNIDFSKEPLKSAGIFAITGTTGSGKSTILDALCLALYDRVPRFAREQTEGIKVKEGEKTISQTDSRNILRKNASEAYAEAAFLALNGHAYISRWSIRRARGKSDGNLGKVEMQLIAKDGEENVQGKVLVTQRIEELIGLSFEQFTRTVLLAQGDFAAFLKARQKDKAELLEKLTGTEIYSKISQAIFQKHKAVRENLLLLEKEYQQFELLGEEEVEARQQRLRELDTEIKTENLTWESLEKKRQWLQRKVQLEQQIKAIQQEIDRFNQGKAERENLRQQIGRWEKLQGIRVDYTNEEQRSIQKTEKRLELQRLQQEFRQGLEEKAVLEKEKQQVEERILQSRQVYRSLKTEIDQAKRIDLQKEEVGKRFQALQQEILSWKTKVEGQQQEQQAVRARLQELKQEEEQSQEFCEKCRPYLPLIETESMQLELIGSYVFFKQELQNMEQMIAREKQQKQSYEEQQQNLQLRIADLSKYEPVEILILRSHLKDGEPCPVCGSLDHGAGQHFDSSSGIKLEELESLLKDYQENLTYLEQHLQDLNRSLGEQDGIFKSKQEEKQRLYAKIGENFRLWKNWENLLEQGNLAVSFSNFTQRYHKETERQNSMEKQRMVVEEQLKNLAGNIGENRCVYEQKLEKEQETRQELQSLQTERNGLLGGKSVDEVVQAQERQEEELTKELETVVGNLRKKEDRNAQIAGQIQQTQTALLLLDQEVEVLHQKVEDYLSSLDWNCTREDLQKYYDEPLEEIQRKKTELQEADKNFIEKDTTLKERILQMQSLLEENICAEGDNEAEILKSQQVSKVKIEALQKENTQITIELLRQKENLEKIGKLKQKEEKLRTQEEKWAQLNALLGSAGGDSFKLIAQAYTLDGLLLYSNHHLRLLSDRYVLHRIPDSLGLEIEDKDMFSERRSVLSLSGGESFLVSLSLALGLASLSSNQMQLSSLFIDEGFGSLDSDTLGMAMQTLERLHLQGKQIGVITHVREMTDKIDCKIRVEKTSLGESKIRITVD